MVLVAVDVERFFARLAVLVGGDGEVGATDLWPFRSHLHLGTLEGDGVLPEMAGDGAFCHPGGGVGAMPWTEMDLHAGHEVCV